MIHTRKSEAILTKDELINKISEYQIFKYYCPPFQELNKKFTSDLRKDNNPTVSIALINDRLRYKDFGYPDHSFDCFSYISYKYGLDFRETLKHIDSSFGLGLASSVHLARQAPKIEKEPILIAHKPAVIKVKVRDWDKEDAAFWKQFYISKQILRIFEVLPITHYWINEKRFSCNSISYRYRFDCGYKIYRPLEDDFKWSSNVGSHCVQGYNQLPKTGGEIFLTSSLKDIMCLAMLGYPSIALQSEMLMPSNQTIEEIQTRFQKITVFYDNDYHNPNNPGQMMANKICCKFDLLNLCIPDKYKSKDISDLVKNHSIKEAKNVIENLERKSKKRAEDKVEADRSGRDQVPF